MEKLRHFHVNGNSEEIKKIFSREFFAEDMSVAVQQPAEYLVSEYSQTDLIRTGAEVTVFLETLYPDLLTDDSEKIAGRIGHTLVAANNLFRQQENLPPLKIAERYGVIFAFSTALDDLTTVETVLE
jgi:hypothetical protein